MNIKKVISLLLVIVMLIPTQSIYASKLQLRDFDIRQDNDKDLDSEAESQEITGQEITTTEQNINDPSDQDDDEWQMTPTIYWNPGISQVEFDQEEIATYSNSTVRNASSSNASQYQQGSDQADGLSPDKAVKSLTNAIRKARKLSRQLRIDMDEVTIASMNPMAIHKNSLYIVRGNGVRISPWEGREDGSRLVFAVDGGQLVLHDLILESQDSAMPAEETAFIYLNSGKLQLGKNLEINGKIILDYQDILPEDLATSSNSERNDLNDASPSNSNINDQKPVIELIKGFSIDSAEYLLDVWADADLETVTMVKMTYSDPATSEEFKEAFRLVDQEVNGWDLIVEEQSRGAFRDTTYHESDLNDQNSTVNKSSEVGITQKSLIGSRALDLSNAVYWNPGGAIGAIPEGNDEVYSGNTPNFPVKSWEVAKEKARERRNLIICMQTIDLAAIDPGVIPQDGSGMFLLEGDSSNPLITVTSWSSNRQPILKVVNGQSIQLKHINIDGSDPIGIFSGPQMITYEGGTLRLEANTTIANGYIQTNLPATTAAAPNPIIVNDQQVKFNLMVNGIQHNPAWRYYDVAEAGDDLIRAAGSEAAAGDLLLTQVTLERACSEVIEGVCSYPWALQKDSAADGDPKPYRIELYTEYFYPAVYLNGVTGNDQYYGGDCQYPVQTFEQAKEILYREISRSVNQRKLAIQEGKTPQEIEAIPVPKVIYICDTVKVTGSEIWTFEEILDEYDQPLHLEVQTHLGSDAGGTNNHLTPELLIEVNGAANALTLGSGMLIRSTADGSSKVSIRVRNNGTLSLRDGAELTGLKDSLDRESRSDILHIDGTRAKLYLIDGTINGGRTGVKVTDNSIVEMSGGFIENNKYENAATTNIDGAGIRAERSVVTMTGGNIRDNQVRYFGAGVFLLNSTFNMKKGVIERNIGLYDEASTYSRGAGIYAGAGSVVNIGEDGGDNSDSVIRDNRARGRFIGVGVYIASSAGFYMKSGTIENNLGIGQAADTASTLGGSGGGIANDGTLHITGGIITGNGADESIASGRMHNIRGAGLHLTGISQIVENAVISNNVTGSAASSISYHRGSGGGIYLNKNTTIKNTVISGNYARTGAGILVGGADTGNQVIVDVIDCTFHSNVASMDYASNPTPNIDGYGAAICTAGSQSVLNLKRVNGTDAESIFYDNTAFYGGGIYSNGEVYITDYIFRENIAYRGGAINRNNGHLEITDSLLEGNKALNPAGLTYSMGGAIYTRAQAGQPGEVRLIGTRLSENESQYVGGAVYSQSTFYATNVEIINNKAREGAGLYLGGGSFYLTDNTGENSRYASKSRLDGNSAVNAGGAYLSGAHLYLDMEEEIQNTATSQGNNLIVRASQDADSKAFLLRAVLKQPETQAANAGTYNVHAQSAGEYSGEIRIDPLRSRIEGRVPDGLGGYKPATRSFSLYLHSTNNYVVYYQTPPDTTDPTKQLAITANATVFITGSVIARPANVTSQSYAKLRKNGDRLEIYQDSYQYGSAVTDAAVNENYIRGGTLPSGTTLGGFRDNENPALTNMILITGGVYLSGSGSDSNDGTTPALAVETFARAKELLEQRAPSLGNTPFIFISGNVEINADEVWELTTANAEVRRFASFVTEPMITVKSGKTLTMGNIIYDGSARGVIADVQLDSSPMIQIENGATVNLGGNSWLRNNHHVMIANNGGKLVLDGNPGDQNTQIDVSWGAGVQLNQGALMEMNGSSRVVISSASRNSSEYYDNSVTKYRGVEVGSGSELLMKDDSSIAFTGAASTAKNLRGLGVLVGDLNQTGNADSKLTMRGNSSITGQHFGIGVSNYNALIDLAGNALIQDNYDGIAALRFGVDNINIKVSENAAVRSNHENGIAIMDSEVIGENGTINIILDQSGMIEKNTQNGVYLYLTDPEVIVTLKGNSSILDNQIGIFEEDIVRSRSVVGSRKVQVKMEGNSRIGNSSSGSQLYGIRFGLRSGQENQEIYDKKEELHTYRVSLSEQAVIGDHLSAGISSDKGMDLFMFGDSLIAGNTTGIYLGALKDYYKGESLLRMAGSSSISNNLEYGILSDQKKNDPGYEYYETIYFTDSASMNNNPQGNVFVYPSELHLYDQARITHPAAAQDVLQMYGSLSLDGTALVTGRIHLYRADHPITLRRAPVSYEDHYFLHLAEEFIGQIVVQPEAVKTVIDAVDYADPYIDKFRKAAADGYADQQHLSPDSPNIILGRDNNVYLSGNGDDDNDGSSPATAVRTFKRAKAVLRSGNYTYGAKIVICDPNADESSQQVPVLVQSDDQDWSFGAEDLMTHPLTGEKWMPVIVRDDNFNQVMIEVDRSRMGTSNVIFKQIQIDGSSTIDTPDQFNKEILKISSGTATLDEGAELIRNSRTVNSTDFIDPEQTTLGVYVDQNGTLMMSGGTIANLKLTAESDFSLNQSIGYAVYNRGNVTLNSGAIEENLAVFDPSATIQSYYVGAVLNQDAGNLEMTGGFIRNNTTETDQTAGDGISGSGLGFEDHSTGSVTGGEITGNTGGSGAAIYYNSDQRLELNGGLITGNQWLHQPAGTVSIQAYSPVYVKGTRFTLNGSSSVIEDAIYLETETGPITMSGLMEQNSREYHIYINQNEQDPNHYKKGSVVVQPNIAGVADVSAYINNFIVYASPLMIDKGQSADPAGTISGVTEAQCLILIRAVFLDSVNGNISNGGNHPQDAVPDFETAKAIGRGPENSDYYVIYISGPVRPQSGESWQMEGGSYMSRYTGFYLYQIDPMLQQPVKTRYPNYQGYLIEAEHSFTLDAVQIYGRREQDDSSANGESILYVKNNAVVEVNEAVSLQRNNNTGTYLDDEGIPARLTNQGGAVTVAIGGTLKLTGALIADTNATLGQAIFQHAGAAGTGKVQLDGTPDINGDIYLDGAGSGQEAYLEVSSTYAPRRPDGGLHLSLGNDRDKRLVVKYPSGHQPTPAQINYYLLEDSVLALYNFNRDPDQPEHLILEIREILYLDGEGGNDANDGSIPDLALKTLEGTYRQIQLKKVKSGAVVFVVNPVPIQDDITLINTRQIVSNEIIYQGSYQKDGATPIDIDAQVFFKRYSQPINHTALTGYSKTTNFDQLMVVEDGGHLTLRGIYLDGHRQESSSLYEPINSLSVDAKAPLITVQGGGTLTTRSSTEIKSRFVNNFISSSVTKGSAAGVEILTDPSDQSKVGIADLQETEFRDLQLAGSVVGGTDVYVDGMLNVANRVLFSGSVYLEGEGDITQPEKSRYIRVTSYGDTFTDRFRVIMRDPYSQRKVVEYPTGGSGEVPLDQIGLFLIDHTVNQYFTLNRRETERNVLELILPGAVYIDGTAGSDNNTGWNPKEPVQSLSLAYEKLALSGGKYIYVLGTINVDSNTTLTNRFYQDELTTISRTSNADAVELVRYIKPTASNSDNNYRVNDFEGALISVENQKRLTIQDHVSINGHHSPRIGTGIPETIEVDRTTVSDAPLIQIEAGSSLYLGKDSSLTDNHNKKTTGSKGGAVDNKGTLILDGGVIEGNLADIGEGIYQDGEMILKSDPDGIGTDQKIYLTSVNNGNEQSPNWSDRIIQSEVWLTDEITIALEMDHAVPGRPVVRYLNHAPVDEQYQRYLLSTTTVAEDLFLVQNKDDSRLLELQNWQVLDVEIPTEIFLVVHPDENGNSGISNAASDGFQMAVPQYTIKNNGRHMVKVLVSGFTNDTVSAGISEFAEMNLVHSAADALLPGADEKDLYLAIKGIDTVDGFAGLAETSLDLVPATGIQLGILSPAEEGNFEFVAAASDQFMRYYHDSRFPYFGSAASAANRMLHLRHKDPVTGVTSPNQARNKFTMKYRLELIPSRR